jgi:hypothetical protein
MTILWRYFASGEWWNLRPAQELLAEQPGDRDSRHFIAAARTTSGDWTVIYLPSGGTVRLNPGARGASARWFDPRTGHWHAANAGDDAGGRQSFVAPDARDWVLDLRRQALTGSVENQGGQE